MALKRLMILRPGETDWNLQGRWQGWVAAPLNEHGRKQAERLAHFMRNMGIQYIYSSDNRRAAETAEILGQEIGTLPIYDERLRERSIGIWQGLTVPEIHGWYADEYAQYRADPDNYIIPGGESLNQVRARVRTALDDIVNKAEAEKDDVNVCVISHTTAIRTILGVLVPQVDLLGVQFGNTAVTSLRHDESGNWQLVAVNDGMHLDGLESRYMPEVRGDN